MRQTNSILADLLKSGIGRTHTCAAAGAWRNGKTLFEEFVGTTSQEGKGKLTRDCLFDIASITKIFTSIIVMQSCEKGLISLNDTIGDIVPGVKKADIRNTNILGLLSHTSGLPPLRNSMKRCASRASVLRVLNSVDLERRGIPVYSDLGFMLLGEIIETVYGKREDELVGEKITTPLGLHSTTYNPGRSRCCASTGYSPIRKRELICETHNEVVARMDGVAGHAGLFSSLGELSLFASTLLNDCVEGKGILLRQSSIRKMIRPVSELFGVHYGLGFMVRVRGDAGYPVRRGVVFGHTGHTGTSVWMDIDRRLVSILLMNNDAVRGKMENVHSMRSEFHSFATGATDIV
jgi:CubicO group peptidase (beta-lactamase class C family)